MGVPFAERRATMNQSLRERYEAEWAALEKTRPTGSQGEEPTNPLLLHVPTSYLDADVGLMIFGQETNDWGGAFAAEGGVQYSVETYIDFYTSGQCYRYGGQFWNALKALMITLTEKVGASGRKIDAIWNNLIKVGKAHEKGAPSQPILKWEDAWFDVVSFEVKLLSPTQSFFSPVPIMTGS